MEVFGTMLVLPASDTEIYWHIIEVIVSNIEQKHGISQTYLFTFDWYFLGDLSHRFKILPQGNIPVLPESKMLVFAYFLTQVWWIGALFFLINNFQPTCNWFSIIFKSCIKTRTTQLSVFVANWQYRDLGKFPW